MVAVAFDSDDEDACVSDVQSVVAPGVAALQSATIDAMDGVWPAMIADDAASTVCSDSDDSGELMADSCRKGRTIELGFNCALK